MFGRKGWWASKTVWTGIIGAFFALLAAFGIVPAGLDSETVLNAVLGVVSLLAIVFRVQATEEVTVKPIA